jgi:hypothetical protein
MARSWHRARSGVERNAGAGVLAGQIVLIGLDKSWAGHAGRSWPILL